MKKILSYALILSGIIVLLFPVLRDWYHDRQQQALLETAEQMAGQAQETQTPDRDLKNNYQQLSRILAAGEGNDSADEPDLAKAKEGDLIGVIAIDKIDLELPILEGATQANLKNAAAHLTGTAPLGEAGNAAIAAHRAHKTGRLFNRLNEVTHGDEIIIKSAGRKLTYAVHQISVVEPTDVSVLEGASDESVITLITCDPLYDATHRLIVQARLVEG